jgi:hypothetical protein
MGRSRRRFDVTEGQTRYLVELITDDLEVTELTNEERQQAETVLGRLEMLLVEFEVGESVRAGGAAGTGDETGEVSASRVREWQRVQEAREARRAQVAREGDTWVE